MNCCKKKRTSDFSFFKGPLKSEPVTNIFCHGCGSHFYGPAGSENLISKEQWEAWINTP